MEIPVYLAMTAAEFRTCSTLPPHVGWLSCLFSPYGRGLSNIPKQLPPNSLLILSDRTPPLGHDPGLICETLSEIISNLSCSGLLLDFEQPNNNELLEIANALISLPCPVAVSASYARELDCPVFLPPPPPSSPLEHHITPWAGREIWLELSSMAEIITVTGTGATTRSCSPSRVTMHKDANLHCHYSIDLEEDYAIFTLQRTLQDWEELLAAAPTLGITHAVGLSQELQSLPPSTSCV